eukprot:TRINITY_DN32933_c0_g1_i1.p1 TRINITY_DN32933_c0_g1~~TRINITY_DN32933_c0_g1_i1.p1  ORF type:complete len:405 (+),score=134.91 TRINITY_DN32933_c0_g1_i1:81-1295(+)
MGVLQWFDRMMAPDDLPETLRARALRCETLRHPLNGNVVYVVGGSHLNATSCRDVQRVVDFAKPNGVLVELCAERLDSVRHRHRFASQILPELSVANLATIAPFAVDVMFWLRTLPTMRLEAVLGINEGAEQATAVQAAAKHRKQVFVRAIDAPCSVTIMKCVTSLWHKVGPAKVAWDFWKTEVLGSHVYPALQRIEGDMTVLEAMMREGTALDAARVDEMQRYAHGVTAFEWDWGTLLDTLKGTSYLEGIIKPLIEERDTVLAHQIYDASRTSRCTVAVVGAAHVAGIKAKFGKTTDEEVAAILQPPTTDYYSVVAQLAALSFVSPACVFYARRRCKQAGGRAWQCFRYARYVGVTASLATSSFMMYQAYQSYQATRDLQVRFHEYRMRMVKDGGDPKCYSMA